MPVPQPPSNRLDKIIYGLAVIDTKVSGLPEKVSRLAEEVAVLKASGRQSNSTWVFVWQGINTAILAGTALIAFLALHH